MRPLLVLTALLATAPALAQSTPAPTLAPAPAPEPPKSVLLVWGGGKTAQEAEAAATDYRERSKDWAAVLLLANDYPRVLKSDTVPGLKPGFHVVVLGVCEPGQGAELERIFDSLEPRTYSREVTWPVKGELPCPQLAEYWSFHDSAQVKSKQGDLLVAAFSMDEAEGDFEERGWLAVLTAYDKKGKHLETRRETSTGNFSEIQQLEAKGGRVRVQERIVDPACHGAPRFQESLRTWSARLGESGISVEPGTEKTLKEGPCEYPELGPNQGDSGD